MKSLTIKPGTAGITIKDIPEPQIKNDHEIKLKIHYVGICGTDRDQASGGRADAPQGAEELIVGHEMIGEVVDTGKEVHSPSIGDYGLFTVRRGCGVCTPCKMRRSDMCYSGLYKERGIKSMHGFQAEFVIDKEDYFIGIPEEIKSVGVLTEPMSIAEKAIDEAVKIQALRIPGFREKEWFRKSRTLVAGIGSVGLLASFILSLRGSKVYGLDIVDENSARPSILKSLGGIYIDGRKISADNIDDTFGEMDFIFEATGIAKLEFQLTDALSRNGIYVLTGIPEGERPVTVMGNEIMREMVLKNQILIGSVNAAKEHYNMAVNDLLGAKKRWGNLPDKMITEKIPAGNFSDAFKSHSADEIKVVIDWQK
ncbi:MAG: glucose 1-dehydrogenase [Ignavibacteria bacterium]